MFKRVYIISLIASIFLLQSIYLSGQVKQTYQIEEFKVFDCPNDEGGQICLTWKKIADEKIGGQRQFVIFLIDDNKEIKIERILVAKEREKLEKAQFVSEGKSLAIDKPKFFGFSRKNENYHFAIVNEIPTEKDGELKNNKEYRFKVKLVENDNILAESPVMSGYAKIQLWDKSKNNVFLFCTIYGFIVVLFIFLAKKNPNMYIRKIAGVDAIEEAIGRATEMGKTVLYLTGLSIMSDIATIAAISILSRVARKVAQYEAKLLVPCYDPIVTAVAKDTIKAAYTDIGRPDAYRDDFAFYVVDSQFPFVAAVDGIMMREKPAANIFMGYYYAESLLLTETGSATGAIQIAGTDAITQLPFFITTCDYTLIGEELYAAGAYISRNPLQLGSLKGEDIGKLVFFIVLIVGTIFSAIGIKIIINLLEVF